MPRPKPGAVRGTTRMPRRRRIPKKPKLTRPRRRLRAADRRELLLDGATRALRHLGVDRVRMDDVAAEACVAKGLLYRHFPSKDALLEALMARKAAAFQSRLAERLSGLDAAKSSPARIVADGLRMWVQQVSADVAECNWLETAEPPAYLRFCDEIRRMMSGTIRQLAPTVSEGLALMVAAALQGVAESVTKVWRDRQDMPQEELVALLLAFCVGGLKETAQHLG